MPALLVIRDPEDPRLADFHLLRTRAARRDPARMWVESELAVERLLASGLPLRGLLSTPARAERLHARLPAGVPHFVAERALLERVVGYDLHRGCVACAERPAPRPLPLEALARRARFGVVVGEGLADPANLGALIRSACAFGVDAFLGDGRGADPYDPRAVRASMGNVFRLPLAVAPDLGAALRDLRRATGARVLAATLGPAATPLPQFVPPPRWVLLLGHEGQGLSPALCALADEALTIPIAPDTDSLNVAAAGAVLLYALSRTRAC